MEDGVSGGSEFFAAGIRGDWFAGAVDNAREGAVAFGAVGGGTGAFALPGNRSAAVDTEAGVDQEGRRVWARSFGGTEAAAADGADAPGTQTVGEERRQRVVASRTTLDVIAVEIGEAGIALRAVNFGWTAIAVVFERVLALGTLLRRGRLRDVVDESKWSLERGELDDGGGGRGGLDTGCWMD